MLLYLDERNRAFLSKTGSFAREMKKRRRETVRGTRSGGNVEDGNEVESSIESPVEISLPKNVVEAQRKRRRENSERNKEWK